MRTFRAANDNAGTVRAESIACEAKPQGQPSETACYARLRQTPPRFPEPAFRKTNRVISALLSSYAAEDTCKPYGDGLSNDSGMCLGTVTQTS